MASDSPDLSTARQGSTPIPAESSFTPPPSSQLLPTSSQTALSKQHLRTPSPVTSHLTSPPPTNRAPLLPTSHPVVLSDLPTPEQVSHAGVDELRTMVDHLSTAVREARTNAAHYKLQYNLLQIDSSEASKRMEVELQLSHREIEVMQEAEERRKAEYMSPAQQAGHAALVGDLNRHNLILQNENVALREMLSQTATELENRDCQALTLSEENRRLRHRIRMNREHMNGILDSVTDGSPPSLMGTPHRTPRHVAASRAPMMQSASREPNTFDALLLADKVLNSQDTATAPSTPKVTPVRHRGHARNTHSLSSLPTTPARRALHPTAAQLHTPPHLSTTQRPYSQRESQPLPPLFSATRPSSASRRRASSDSTITASSVDEDEHDEEGGDDAIPESQASQVATSMLRRTPNPSQQNLGKRKLTQSRITGKVIKSVAVGEKRMGNFNAADLEGSPSKKGRVGLGIGL
ncbi:3-dehydroshikimate dehydratase [Venturia nashicola]|uniref:3-dehydroshikimate dehydratase n=1 Tax=Venturia nashicola TaxID=86259 RepID=A0A4Z1P848_9PEZI|nr:3-dehydroshikimate dehydratase [Venturia nashicola]